MRGEQQLIGGAPCTAAEEGHDGRRNNRQILLRLARKPCVTAKFAPNARQQIFVRKRRQPHRDRVNKDHFVSGARKPSHQVFARMRVVIPEIFAAETDD